MSSLLYAPYTDVNAPHSADVNIPQPKVLVPYEPPSASDVEKANAKKSSAKNIVPGKIPTPRYVIDLYRTVLYM